MNLAFRSVQNNHSSIKSQPELDISLAHTRPVKTVSKIMDTRKLSHSEIELSKCFAEGNTEPLLKQYSCAWHKDGSILIHGRMYITSLHICFYSNILGWETKLAIAFSEVTGMTKEKTARVFSNAINIVTLEKEYFLTSFIHRNNAFRVLQLVWKYSLKGIQLTKDELSGLIKDEKHREETTKMHHRLNGEDDDEIFTDSGRPKNGQCSIPPGPVLAPPSFSSTPGSSDSTPTTTTSSDQIDYISETTLTERRVSNCSNGSNSDDSASVNSSVNGTHSSIDAQPVKREFYQERSVCAENETSTRILRNLNLSVVINIIILTLIVLLMVSMLSIICKLCELDPNLRSWLKWQPWCFLFCHT